MKIRHFFLLGPFLTVACFAQQQMLTLNGKIMDKSTQQAVPNAYVALSSKGTGTLANTDGEFTLKTSAINQAEVLSVTVVGYRTVSKPIADFQVGIADTLWLEPVVPVALDTAFTHHVDPKKIVADALFRVKANCQLNSFMLTGFYQETLWRDSAYVKISEAVLKAEKNPTPPAKIPEDFMPEKLKLIKGRQYEKLELTEALGAFGFGNGPMIVSHSMETGIPEYLEGKNLDDYQFALDSLLTAYHDRPVLVLRFRPANKKVKAAREGVMYIDSTSRAIVGIQYQFTPEGTKDVVKSTFKSVFGGLKTDVKYLSASYFYRPFNGKWYLQDAALQLEANLRKGKEFETVATIKLAFVTNEIALKFNPPIRPDEHLQTTDNLAKGGPKYEETYWGNFNAIKPTEAMKAIVKRPVGKR